MKSLLKLIAGIVFLWWLFVCAYGIVLVCIFIVVLVLILSGIGWVCSKIDVIENEDDVIH